MDSDASRKKDYLITAVPINTKNTNSYPNYGAYVQGFFDGAHCQDGVWNTCTAGSTCDTLLQTINTDSYLYIAHSHLDFIWPQFYPSPETITLKGKCWVADWLSWWQVARGPLSVRGAATGTNGVTRTCRVGVGVPFAPTATTIPGEGLITPASSFATKVEAAWALADGTGTEMQAGWGGVMGWDETHSWKADKAVYTRELACAAKTMACNKGTGTMKTGSAACTCHDATACTRRRQLGIPSKEEAAMPPFVTFVAPQKHSSRRLLAPCDGATKPPSSLTCAATAACTSTGGTGGTGDTGGTGGTGGTGTTPTIKWELGPWSGSECASSCGKSSTTRTRTVTCAKVADGSALGETQCCAAGTSVGNAKGNTDGATGDTVPIVAIILPIVFVILIVIIIIAVVVRKTRKNAGAKGGMGGTVSKVGAGRGGGMEMAPAGSSNNLKAGWDHHVDPKSQQSYVGEREREGGKGREGRKGRGGRERLLCLVCFGSFVTCQYCVKSYISVSLSISHTTRPHHSTPLFL